MAMGSWPRRALALFAGVIAALAHPPFGFLPGLLAYGLLMHLTDGANSAKEDGGRPLRSAFLTGWLAGLGYFLVGVWWVVEAFLVDAKGQGWMAPIALALLAGGLALFWGLGCVVYRRLAPSGPWRILVFAGAMTAAEWLRGHVLTGMPWNLPGETWAAGSAPSQAAAVLGAYGLTWVTLAIAAGLTVILEDRTGRNLARAAVAGLALLYLAGFLRLAAPEAAPTSLRVRIVQPNVAQESKYDQAIFSDIVRRYLALTERPAADGRRPDVVIWPEGAIPASVNDYLAPNTWTRDAIQRALTPGQVLLVGGYRVDGPLAAPVYYNSLVAIRRTPEGLTPAGVYDKHRLVPGGEFLPFDKFWTAIGMKTLAHIGDGFAPGPPPRPLTVAGLPAMQPLICYESLFPGFTRAGAGPGLHDRPRWIVNISNDAWFGATSGPRQHLNLAAYRAIEEGLPMVRSTPTGVSAVIDARGRVLAALPMGAADALDLDLPGAEAATPFEYVGESTYWVLLIVSIGFCVPIRNLMALAKRRKS